MISPSILKTVDHTIAPRRATAITTRGIFSKNNEDTNDSGTVENRPESLPSPEVMHGELDEINAQRNRAQLAISLDKARVDRDD